MVLDSTYMVFLRIVAGIGSFREFRYLHAIYKQANLLASIVISKDVSLAPIAYASDAVNQRFLPD